MYGIHIARCDGSSFMYHQPCQRCKYTTSVDIEKRVEKKKEEVFTRVEYSTGREGEGVVAGGWVGGGGGSELIPRLPLVLRWTANTAQRRAARESSQRGTAATCCSTPRTGKPHTTSSTRCAKRVAGTWPVSTRSRSGSRCGTCWGGEKCHVSWWACNVHPRPGPACECDLAFGPCVKSCNVWQTG